MPQRAGMYFGRFFCVQQAVSGGDSLFFILDREVGETMGVQRNRQKLPYPSILILLGAALLAAVAASAALGRYPIAPRELAGILLSRIVPITPFWNPVQESLFLQHRLPRILLACLVGGGLSAAGTAYQGVFQNPMAAPDILGASSGAGFGAALAILLGLGRGLTVAMAFGFGLLTVGAVVYTSRWVKGKQVLGLVLSGMIVSSLASSGTSLIKLTADPQNQLPAITYWLMGSLNGASPKDVWLAAVPMALGLIPLLLLRWRINLLTLGDGEARSMGVNAGALRTVVLLCATLATAASVAVSGMIGWVGLVVPHLAGEDYSRLLPAAVLFGAVFLLLVDDLSRSLMASEIPIGILTSFVGAPFFLYFIARDGERH